MHRRATYSVGIPHQTFKKHSRPWSNHAVYLTYPSTVYVVLTCSWLGNHHETKADILPTLFRDQGSSELHVLPLPMSLQTLWHWGSPDSKELRSGTHTLQWHPERMIALLNTQGLLMNYSEEKPPKPLKDFNPFNPHRVSTKPSVHLHNL